MDASLIAWVALFTLTIVGIAGVLLPGLPGIALILIGALIHKLLLPHILSWWVVSGIGVLALVGWIAELVGFVLGAKWGGASRAGMIGAAIGALVGLFFAPIGLLVGPVMGTFVGELTALRTVQQATRSGVFAGVGFVFSTMIRLVLSLIATTAILIDLFI